MNKIRFKYITEIAKYCTAERLKELLSTIGENSSGNVTIDGYDYDDYEIKNILDSASNNYSEDDYIQGINKFGKEMKLRHGWTDGELLALWLLHCEYNVFLVDGYYKTIGISETRLEQLSERLDVLTLYDLNPQFNIVEESNEILFAGAEDDEFWIIWSDYGNCVHVATRENPEFVDGNTTTNIILEELDCTLEELNAVMNYDLDDSYYEKFIIRSEE